MLVLVGDIPAQDQEVGQAVEVIVAKAATAPHENVAASVCCCSWVE